MISLFFRFHFFLAFILTNVHAPFLNKWPTLRFKSSIGFFFPDTRSLLYLSLEFAVTNGKWLGDDIVAILGLNLISSKRYFKYKRAYRKIFLMVRLRDLWDFTKREENCLGDTRMRLFFSFLFFWLFLIKGTNILKLKFNLFVSIIKMFWIVEELGWASDCFASWRSHILFM